MLMSPDSSKETWNAALPELSELLIPEHLPGLTLREAF